MTLDEEITRLIKATLESQGKSQASLARHLGINPSSITRLLNPKRAEDGKSTKHSHDLTVRELQQIFQFLGMELSRDMFVSPRKVHVKLAPLRGTVAHGVW